MKDFLNHRLTSAVLFLLIGLALVIWPNAATEILIRVVGALLVTATVFRVIAFVKSQKEMSDILTFVLWIVIGLIGLSLVIAPAWLTAYVFTVLGILIVVIGAVFVLRSLRLPKIGYGWLILLIFAAAVTVLGILVIWNPFAAQATLVRIIGVGFLVAAVTYIAEYLSAKA